MFPTKDKFICKFCQKGYNTQKGLGMHYATKHICEASQISTTTMNINNGNVVNGNNTTVNSLHIHMPRNFGDENTSYITKEYLAQIAHCFSSGITELMRNVHFHPEHPENHNVRLACKRDKIIEKVKDGKWVKSSHDQIEKAMVHTGSKMVLNCMVEPEFMQKYLTLFDAMMDDYVKTTCKDNSKASSEVKSRLYVMILDESGKIQYLEEDAAPPITTDNASK